LLITKQQKANRGERQEAVDDTRGEQARAPRHGPFMWLTRLGFPLFAGLITHRRRSGQMVT
jgi:hypothetical protein